MDFFGIGHVLRVALSTYTHVSRRSGRTTALLRSAKPGDIIVCLSAAEARRIDLEIYEMYGSDYGGIETKVVPVGAWEKLNGVHAEGQLLFEHTWVEAFYERELKHAADLIGEIRRRHSAAPKQPQNPRFTPFEHQRWR